MNILSSITFFDYKIAESIISLRSYFWDSFFLSFTKLGNWPVIAGLFIIISIFFYFNKKRSLILPFFFTILGAGIMTILIKFLADRIRPGTDIALYTETGASFPSAHAALSFALFGFLIYCLWRFDLSLKIKIGISLIFTLIILLIGFSRLYLGVHFFTDVMAGYLTGLMWVLLGMYFSRRFFLL